MDAYAAGDTISVTFRLIGDFPESETGTHLGYVNWIETTSYSLETGSTVADLFDTALKDAGLSSKNTRADYVSEDRAPQIYGGYWLAEFDNGRNSGWMYTVNGKHPGVASQQPGPRKMATVSSSTILTTTPPRRPAQHGCALRIFLRPSMSAATLAISSERAAAAR